MAPKPVCKKISYPLAVLSGLFILLISCDAYCAQARYTPWSGWWWPFRSGGLATGRDYRDHPAPLEKYLLYTEGITSGPLITWYMSMYYKPSGEDWWGLCPYWARASVKENYDILPSSIDNLLFRVGDKKGLLTVCHDWGDVTHASGDDPVDFHFWLLDYIGDQGVAFTADMDPGAEVWYHPIYRYEMQTTRSGQIESVNVRIYYALDNVTPDYIGTLPASKTLTYDLYLNSINEITGGAWTGTSIGDHPENLSFPINTSPRNPYLDYATVKKIAQSKDDFLEMPGNPAVNIQPGTYHLVLLDQDQYMVNAPAGDLIYFKLGKDDTSDQAIDISVSDKDGNPVFSQVMSNRVPLEEVIEVENPPYTISLSQTNYGDPNIYDLTIDRTASFSSLMPYIPKNGPWSGVVITNAGNAPVEKVTLATCMPDGHPLQTVFGPSTFAPGEKRVLMFEDLPWRKHEYGDTTSLKLMADQPVSMLNILGADQQPMAAQVQGDAWGSRLVIPDTFSENTFSRQMTGAVFNESFSDATVVIKIYDSTGLMVLETEATVSPGSRYDIIPGQRPFYHMPDGGWIDVSAPEGSLLSAYEKISNTAGTRNALETLFALPVDGNVCYVPHITPTLGWWETSLTLINPSDMTNNVILHPVRSALNTKNDLNITLEPREKRVINLSTAFGNLGGDLDRSILKIFGENPIAGYYSYSPPYGGDEAFYPLMDAQSFKAGLVLPHFAGKGGYFWTGIVICNPADYEVQVNMTPYGANGDAMATKSETMAPGAYTVFRVEQAFPDAVSKIEFIRFEGKDVLGADAPIGGFYMMGNMIKGVPKVEMVAGANM